MIKVYDAFTDDFSGQGLGYIMPIKAEIEEEPAGLYEIEVQIPIDDSRDDWLIDHERIIAAKSPTRTSPEINFGLNGSIKRQIYKANAAAQMYNLANRKKKLKKYKKGTKFIRLEVDGSWYKVSTIKGGTTGWIKTSVLDFESEADDIVEGDNASRVVETVLAKEQFFRVHYIKRNTENLILTAEAEHISNDLKGVICEKKYAPENIPADEVVAQLIAKADQTDLPFNIYCECTDPITADYTGRNLIDCLLNSDDGVATQCKGRVVRDNFDFYILKPYDRYTGAEIRYADNMISANQETESGDRISRIRPVGKNKKGEPLYITENDGYVDSPNADKFAVKRTKQIEYSEAQTGRNGLSTDAKTRAKLKELALKEFEGGIDAINGKIDAKFIRHELTEEFKNTANEAALHMYDIARIRASRAGIKCDVRMTSYKFDALPGRERYIDTKISDLIDEEPIVYGGDIGNNSISGSKIVNNSIDGSTKIKDLSVGIGKFDLATIDQLNANSITALIARINEIVAGSVTTDELYASIAEIIGLKVGSLTASDITTDRLAAALATFTVITAGTASFDRATVEHLVANLFNLTGSAVMEDVFIHNLKIAYAQIVSASIGNLVLQSSDGKYYQIDVSQSGQVTASQVYPSAAEKENGVFGETRPIIATQMTVDEMNASTIKAVSMLVNKIDAAKIDTDELFAREAFITQLTTSKIVGDKSLILISQFADDAKAAAEQAKTTADTANANAASAQTAASDAAKSASAANTSASSAASDASAAKTAATNAQGSASTASANAASAQTAASDAAKSASAANTSASSAASDASAAVAAATNAQGSASTASAAASNAATSASDAKKAADTASAVANEAKSDAKAATDIANAAKATADTASNNAEDALRDATSAGTLAQKAVDKIGDIPTYVEIPEDGSGVYIKDIQEQSVVKINSGSVSIGAVSGAAKGYSQLTANYVQFGNYQLRKSGDGGLVFKLAEG